MKRIVFLFYCLLLPFNSFAHEDKVLKLEKDGTLVGLPEKYAPAKFVRKNFHLTIGENTIHIPECVKEVFSSLEKPTFYFTASWYHNLEILPPYIQIEIKVPDNSNSWQLLINLDTLDILHFYKSISKLENGELSYQSENIEISEKCKKK